MDSTWWKLIYNTADEAIETKSDVIIAVVHWYLLLSGMKCVGFSILSDSDIEMELLPDEWSINKSSYALRYKYKYEIFVLVGTVDGNSIVLNLLNFTSLEATKAAFALDATVASIKGETLKALIPDIEPVLCRLHSELVGHLRIMVDIRGNFTAEEFDERLKKGLEKEKERAMLHKLAESGQIKQNVLQLERSIRRSS
ncbi:proteasome inhibitor PI31 subunit-like [Bradysia coprophila]|uniref:proteasome inhibitor PI31 subunit-like n=1 Tax=Bradysia coprophila TaxID=38358 RepID=UPI00187D796A|nr:proteasome inhibitor PI31 subunit-like [Bradysia coprophila]